MTNKIHCIDRTEQAEPLPAPAPGEPPESRPEPGSRPRSAGLSPAGRKILNARRRVRAKREARLIGHAAYQGLPESRKKHLADLAAILSAAGINNDSRATRIIMRAFVDGLLLAANEDRQQKEGGT